MKYKSNNLTESSEVLKILILPLELLQVSIILCPKHCVNWCLGVFWQFIHNLTCNIATRLLLTNYDTISFLLIVISVAMCKSRNLHQLQYIPFNKIVYIYVLHRLYSSPTSKTICTLCWILIC